MLLNVLLPDLLSLVPNVIWLNCARVERSSARAFVCHVLILLLGLPASEVSHHLPWRCGHSVDKPKVERCSPLGCPWSVLASEVFVLFRGIYAVLCAH